MCGGWQLFHLSPNIKNGLVSNHSSCGADCQCLYMLVCGMMIEV